MNRHSNLARINVGHAARFAQDAIESKSDPVAALNTIRMLLTLASKQLILAETGDGFTDEQMAARLDATGVPTGFSRGNLAQLAEELTLNKPIENWIDGWSET